MGRTQRLCMLLTGLGALAALAALLLRTFAPVVILPPLNIPLLSALFLAALAIDRLSFDGKQPIAWAALALCGGLVAGLFPFAIGLVCSQRALRMALAGALGFPLLTLLFTACCDRPSAERMPRFRAIWNAFLLFLAFQATAGIWI